MQQIFVQQPSM